MVVLVAEVVAVIVATTALARGEATTRTADGDDHPAFPDRDAGLPQLVPAPLPVSSAIGYPWKQVVNARCR
jgi:hypothetical protein